MDDFVISGLHESRNEWCSRLVTIFTPLVVEGIRSIFDEAWKMCADNDELNKYLMTFQNLLSRIPKWTDTTVEDERKRIIQRSGCNYLVDLITCVHIIQLKVLTAIRVGNKQKKIDLTIPKLDVFIHRVYINVARKVYTNVYLFEKNISPLTTQKNNRELELIVQEAIMTTIRESIPTEEIIRAYMAESVEHEEEVVIENIPEPVLEGGSENLETKPTSGSVNDVDTFPKAEEAAPITTPTVKDLGTDPVITRLTFNNYDSVMDTENRETTVPAPKTIERLEEISTQRAIQRKIEEEEDEMEERIKISTDSADLASLGITDLDKPASEEFVSLDDIEELM